MKLTDFEIIKSGEQELIDSINGELDWEVMEEIFQKVHKLELGEDVEYRRGDLVVHNNEVAYQLEFDVKVKLSILIDRKGNHLSYTTTTESPEKIDTVEASPKDASEKPEVVDGEVCPEDQDKKVLDGPKCSDTTQDAGDKLDISRSVNVEDRISETAAKAVDVMKEFAA